jgi:type II secretory pathway pseudopilin PulG
MRRATLFRRLRARAARGESGFTLIETVIAITVIFGSLTALAYTATASFHYQDVARQRQTANGVAAKVMEEIRGLAYDKVVAGLLNTDLAGDSNIVSCSGVYRFLSCTAGTEPGSGEKIINNAGLTTTVPLVPHRSSTAPNTDPVLNNLAYKWSTYVTQDDTVANAPYRVTVVVTWTGGLTGGAKLVRIQSLFWSPIGCRNTSTHPFSAPCQPFLLSNATVPNGDIAVTGTLGTTTFSGLDVQLMGASATAQQEQISSAEGSVHSIGASITDDSTRTAGGVPASTKVDGDPNSGTGQYSRVRCGTEITCTGGTLTSPAAAGSTYIQTTVPDTMVGESDSAISATGTNVCPPTLISATAQVDSQPCGGVAVQQDTSLVEVAHLHGAPVDVGDANIVRVGAPPSNNAKAFVDRVINPAPAGAGCTPAASTDGCIAASASRTYGSIRLAQLPANMTSPFPNANCSGYFLSITGYTDSVTGAAGYGSPLPTATAPAGTLYYYDPASNSCASLAMNSGSISGLNKSYTTTQNVSGTPVTVTISTVAANMSASSTSTVATPSTGGSQTRTDVSAQVVAPKLSVRYTITSAGQTIMDITETVNLGTLTVDASYTAAPSAGS